MSGVLAFALESDLNFYLGFMQTQRREGNVGLVFLLSSDHWDGREAWALPVRLPILGMSLSSMDGGG